MVRGIKPPATAGVSGDATPAGVSVLGECEGPWSELCGCPCSIRFDLISAYDPYRHPDSYVPWNRRRPPILQTRPIEPTMTTSCG